jgi:glycosyltransferase involved in cell wall biosynthesis
MSAAPPAGAGPAPWPSVSVVICAYTEERWDDLTAAVASVQAQTRPPAEILVVVDHNPALLARAAARWPGPGGGLRPRLLENEARRGLSGARNSGVAAAGGEVVAFLDDDAAAAPDWLDRLAVRYADRSVLGVGGAIEPLWLGGRPRWFPDEFDWIVGCTYRGMPRGVAPVRNLIGCNMSFRREVFDGAGGFRSEVGRIGALPLGCEETELCIRVRQRWPESRLLYDPAAAVRHRVPARRGGWRYFRARCYAEGLSKATVARLVGAGDGLASERTYTLRTLPQGVARGLRDAVLRRDATGFGRAGAIVLGLGFTAAGYLQGSVAPALRLPAGAAAPAVLPAGRVPAS